ncbi:MAG: calcium-translocating P-type ATPase, SERCA-type [Candidatus Aenigmatarchaeota archaeon]
MQNKEWYKLTAEETIKELGSDIYGLTEQEAKERFKKYGPNELKEKKTKSYVQIFLEQFKSFLILILIFATIISIFLGEILDAIVIFIIIIINAFIGFYQERKAKKAIESLKKLASPQTDVIRDKKIKTIFARELVPGDIIILESGKKVPADARIIESMNLQVDESILTGESIPVEKDNLVLKKNLQISDRKNMLFSGTTVTYGRCKAIVVNTGMKTEIGKIADMIQEKEKPTILQLRLEKLGKQLGIIVIIICALIFFLGFLHGKELFDTFLTAVALAVAAIPEGMPAIVTIALAIGVQKMAKRNAIIRRIHSVETLGCTDVICTDKTGTLTINKMTARKIYINEKFIDVTGEGYNIEGKFLYNGHKFEIDNDTRLLLHTCLLCNDAQLQDESIIGDPTEVALIVVALKSVSDVRDKYKRIDEIPFDSSRKMMTTINVVNNKKIAYSKGAPEILLDKCSFILKNGNVRRMTKKDRDEILKANNKMTNDAMRVLAFAYKELHENYMKEWVEKNMIFIGLIGCMDPPRKEAKESINLCKKAGINVIMITGDHKNTAIAIAKELGIYDENKKVLTGEELDKISDTEFNKIVDDVTIYARVSPEHKLKIINALKAKKHIVSMIGDGINDAPALKKSDIAVSVGSGTDVAKDVSDMILMDNNFVTIVSAVEEGRGLYDNIKKTINYLLACNFGEILTIFTAIILNLPTPLLPIQILWMNLVTDGLPALALGVNPPDPDIMERKPRIRDEKILNKQTILFILSVGIVMCIATIFLFIQALDKSFTKASTIAFTMLIFTQMVFALITRSERYSIIKLGIFSNKKLIIAIAISIILQFMIIYIPFFNSIFGTIPLNLSELTIIIFSTIIIFFIFEIIKIIKKLW